jgi:hypothetical protein
MQPFGPLEFTTVSAGLLTEVLTLILILGPADAWWAFAFPRELAMYRLAHASNYFDFGGCPYYPAEDWQLLRDQPNAAELFDSVATHAESAAGRVMAEAGRIAVGGKPMAAGSGSQVAMTESIRSYWNWDREQMITLSQALEPPLFDSVLALLQRPRPHFEC